MKPSGNHIRAGGAPLWWLGLFALFLVLADPLLAAEGGRRHLALLVGCTQYQNEYLPALYGPENDVKRFCDLLLASEAELGFTKADIQCLAGWPDDPAGRPTHANIVAAFQRLIDQSDSGKQIVILMAGHGVQVPISDRDDSLDAGHSEPDGMDEVFLPADVGSWREPDGLDRAIRDDQIAQWLDAMRDRGADVWIIFDCCHSGSMSRGSEQLERPRGVRPQALGIPDDAIARGWRLASTAPTAERTRGTSALEKSMLQLTPRLGERSKGSLVAFYAAQPWETAPELPLPEGVAPVQEHYCGLLSYTLAESLLQVKRPMSYRDLARRIVARYRADRHSRPPTPVFEGDLDRRVLGIERWPSAQIVLQHRDGQLQLSGGALLGLTPGSILAVQPPMGNAERADTVLGYVRVVSVTPVTAEVVPSEFNGHAAVPAADLPELSCCQLISREFGDMRITVAVPEITSRQPTGQPIPQSLIPRTLESMPDEVRALINVVKDEDQAEWVLCQTTPEQARERYGLQLKRDSVLLLQAGNRSQPTRHSPPTDPFRQATATRKIGGRYPSNDARHLAAALARDLPKIFRWQNIWRIAGTMPDGSESDRGRLRLDVVKLKHARDQSGGEPLDESFVRPGQVLEYRFENDSDDDLWVTALFLDANFGIEVYRSGSLRSGRDWRPIRVMITDEAVGPEGIVVFATPISVCRQEPAFSFLEQQPLGVVDPATRSAATPPATPFERLLRAAAVQSGTRGGRLLAAPSNPTVISRSWVTVNSANSQQDAATKRQR